MSNFFKRVIVSSLIFIILIGLFLVTINLEYNRVIENEKKDLNNYVEALKSDVDKLLKQRIINLRGFVPYIQINPDLTQDEFVAFASRLLSTDDIIIKDVTFATDTTITHVYPLEGNEAIMDVDLTTLKGQKEVVLMVKEKGEIVIDGPFEIVEGGVGIICRIPVFLDSKKEASSYLGQLNYVVNFDVFLEQTGL